MERRRLANNCPDLSGERVHARLMQMRQAIPKFYRRALQSSLALSLSLFLPLSLSRSTWSVYNFARSL